MLAERIELIAHGLPGGKWKPGVAAFELTKIATEVRALEAREQARLSALAYSTSPSDYGGLQTVTSASHCSEWPQTHRDYPHIASAECEELP